MFNDLVPFSNVHELNLDWIIAKVKEYVEKTDALEISFADLKNYVENYFDNLDVQEEIDTKLEEMLDNGELASLIAQFLTTESLLVFNTKALMKSASNLVNGVSVMTIGDSVYNDGNTRLYYIRTLTSADTIDDVNIIALTNYPTLIAELIHNNFTESERKIIFVGDSFMALSQGTSGIMYWLPGFMGLSSDDYYDATRNAAGFNATYKYIDQVQALSIDNPYEITDIYICGGWNDRNDSDSNLETAMETFMQYVKQTFPNAVVKVAYLGWTGVNSLVTRQEAINGFFKYKLCEKHGMVYVTNSQFINHLYTGFESDYHHPNEDGAKNMARHLASALITGCADVNYQENAVAIAVADSNPYSLSSASGELNINMTNGMTNITSSSFIRFELPSAQTVGGLSFINLGQFDISHVRPFLSYCQTGVPIWLYDGSSWTIKSGIVQIGGDITTGKNTISVCLGESVSGITRIQIHRLNINCESLWS